MAGGVAFAAGVLALTACAGHSGAATSAASSLAANPTVSADVNKVMTNFVNPCVQKYEPHVTKIVSCVEDAVPPAQRTQFAKCLADGYSGELAKSAYHTKTAFQVWKKTDIQACVNLVVK